MQYSGFIQKVFQKFNKLDINEIKNIMVELSTEKELYKLVFDSMIEGVIVTNKDNKVILINMEMEDFISVSKKRILFQEIEKCNFSPEISDIVYHNRSFYKRNIFYIDFQIINAAHVT
ncbi:MAG TPA: hypothetical protein ENI15_07325, partial [Spirochaetes bacterium]|nr:hypothetical protein [Spirochaetota bacterium]